MNPMQSNNVIKQEELELSNRIRKIRNLINEARQVYAVSSYCHVDQGESRLGLTSIKPSKIIRGEKLKISASE